MKSSLIKPALKLLAYSALGGTALVEAASSGGTDAAAQITLWTALGGAALKTAGTLAGEVSGGLFHDMLFGDKKSLTHKTIIDVTGDAIGRSLAGISDDLLKTHPDNPGLETLHEFIRKHGISQLQKSWHSLVTEQVAPQLTRLTNSEVENHLNDGALLRADDLVQLVAALTTDAKDAESYLDDDMLRQVSFRLLQTLPASFVDVLTDEHSGKVYRQRIHEMLNDLRIKVDKILVGVETLLNRPTPQSAIPNPQSKAPAIKITLPPPLTPHLFGRDDELQLLDEAWASPSTKIVVFHALGGAGKSALVSKWLARMAAKNYDGARRVFGWSFFSQGSSENRSDSSEAFIDSALAFFGVTVEGDYFRKADRLAEALRAERMVLVLDGVEPLQYPPNTAGLPEGGLKDRVLQTILTQLAAQQPGLCIITSRERLSDLNGYDEATVIQRPLDHVPFEAGAQLLRKLGVDGDDNEMIEAAKEFKGHAYGLTLLGSYLTTVMEGDIRKRKEIANLFEDDRFGPSAEKMIVAYEKWLGDGVEIAILRMLGLFDRPAEAASIAALRAAPAIVGLTETICMGQHGERERPELPATDALPEGRSLTLPVPHLSEVKWQQALSRLRRIYLLSPANPHAPGELDAHPLVREHFRQQLKTHAPDAWRAGNLRLYKHLTRTTKEFPDTLAQMQPLFAAVMHGCAAGCHQEVYDDVYRRRLDRGIEYFSTKKLGAFSADLAALGTFFAIPWENPSSRLCEKDQANVLNVAGFDLAAVGRTEEAINPYQAALNAFTKQGEWGNAAQTASNLSELFIVMGNLPQAQLIAQLSVEFADKSRDEFARSAFRTTLGAVLHQSGNITDAESQFRIAEALQQERQHSFHLLHSLQGFRYCDLLLSKKHIEDARSRANQTLTWKKYGYSKLDIALDQLMLGLTYLDLEVPQHTSSDATTCDSASNVKMQNIRLAADWLQLAVDGLRQAGQQQYFLRGLLARAAWARVAQQFDQAHRDLVEARSIAERGEMRLHLCDYHLEAARLHLAQGNHDEACDHWDTARAMVAEMGYHRRDAEVEELAVALQALG